VPARAAEHARQRWHLHQSLLDTSRNDFVSHDKREVLSSIGRAFLAGLLANARAAAAFATPTLNGYKRYHGINSMAPIQAIWGRDNRGAMVRVMGAPGDPATHLENRVGEPLANPYLYMASQIHAGLDGIARKLAPGPSADAPYRLSAVPLPKNLMEALERTCGEQVLPRRLRRRLRRLFHRHQARRGRAGGKKAERPARPGDRVGAPGVFRSAVTARLAATTPASSSTASPRDPFRPLSRDEAAKSCGVPGFASAANCFRRACIASDFSATLVSALSLAMMAAGVPVGTRIPAQDDAMKSGTPLSIMVGTSASSGRRCGVATPSARILPS
jgi:hypothetical protein